MSLKIDEDPKTFDWDQKNMYLDVKRKKRVSQSQIDHFTFKKKMQF